MLTQAQRTTILELHTQGVSRHEIARVLGISRPSVRKVLRSQTTEVPDIHRAEKAEPYRQRILDLFSTCKGNLVRVHEELLAGGASLSYQALTAFCRRHGIGQTPTTPVGRYDFEPGEKWRRSESASGFASRPTRSGMRIDPHAWNVPSTSSSSTSWPGGPSPVGRI
jgi:predicted transcriptional regulator